MNAVLKPPPTEAAQGLSISVRQVVRGFGALQVLLGLDLAIAPGEFVAIVGRSGCGKSTLLRLLGGLDVPDTGSIDIGGVPLTGLSPEVRLMYQEARLLPWQRVDDNVALGLPGDRAHRRAAALAALGEVGLADRAAEWPRVLSGGQKQRVALARALAHRPRVLLLDEPLGALDALTRIAMQRLIETLWREHGFTAVLVTHDVSEALALADRVVLIDHGRVALDLPVDLPRPRVRGDAHIARLEAEVLSSLLDEPQR
ncbi:ATP-binding cassette domain-containing protein [Verticiella sediminum]|uniref:ATP-binding cassette domain-containing protein n=1 Tax=Verticiella sediminum TaxID=1247510 RepID=A0A556ANQ0_9BURK|nr:ATP-binding cassette domain-containing protein [Verticiella sediminum]TSH94514.1 ATP-binding cassette domain-containing protein [Verticiella sediminum]